MSDFIPAPAGASEMVAWDPYISNQPYTTRWDCIPSVWDSAATIWDGGASVWDQPVNGETFWLEILP